MSGWTMMGFLTVITGVSVETVGASLKRKQKKAERIFQAFSS